MSASRRRNGPLRWTYPLAGLTTSVLALTAVPVGGASAATGALGRVGAPAAPVVVAAPVVAASDGDIGHADRQTGTSAEGATQDKPQSKLWFNDGAWWASMFTGSGWHIFKLDRASQSWSDTGTQLDSRANTRADTLWDGTHLYVASNVLAASSSVNLSPSPARLFRYSYAGGKYTIDSGFPTNINNVSSESLTLDKDSKGVLWATWTQGKKVFVNSTTGGDTSWGTPFSPEVKGISGLSDDDISSLVRLGNGQIALMWSNQVAQAFYVAAHRDSDPRSVWSARASLTGSSIADDHLNLKTLDGDSSGRFYAAVKTSRDLTGNNGDPQILALGIDVDNGQVKQSVVGTVGDCLTRPVIQIDSSKRVMHLFATAPTASGCPHSGTPGTIYEKTAPLDSLSFSSGRGDAVIRDASSAMMNNPTGSKQNVSPSTGLVVLASNDSTNWYWHSFDSLGGNGSPTPPTTQPAPGPGPAPISGRRVTFGGSTFTGKATPTKVVTLVKPARTRPGDLLIASFTTDNHPGLAAPAGWRPIAVLRPTGATVLAYYHVVTRVDVTRRAFTWRLTAAQKWSGGIERFVGASPRMPFDTRATGGVIAKGSTVTVPGLVTRSPGDLLIGAVGGDSGKYVAMPPRGWWVAGQNRAGQVNLAAFRATWRPGWQGPTSWRINGVLAAGAWTVALRPA